MNIYKCTNCGATDDAGDLEEASPNEGYACNNCLMVSMVAKEKNRMTYKVVIYKSSNDVLFKVLAKGKSERAAERIESGAEINLNHDRYYVAVEQEI